jgi:hypothetical protein
LGSFGELVHFAVEHFADSSNRHYEEHELLKQPC